MAPLEPALVETDYARAGGRGAGPSVRQRALVVLLTALDPAPVEEGLLPVLGPLVRRHQVVLASVADPRVAELAAGRGDAEAVYDAAAAERAVARPRAGSAELLRPPRRRGGRRAAGRPATAAGRQLPGPQGRRPALSPPRC